MTTGRMEHTGAAPAVGLAAQMNPGDMTFAVTPSGNGYPTGGVGSFVIAVDPGLPTEEHILCSARSGVNFTVNASPNGRGFDNTTAQIHAAGATNVEHVAGAFELDDYNAHIYVTTRDDHTQYARTDGTRAITGTQTFSNGITVASGTSALQATTTTSVLASLSGSGRYVGSTGGGAPSSGTFLARDFVVDALGVLYTCLVGGTPGTWEVGVGGVVAKAIGPAANTLVTNTSTTILTVTTPTLITGHIYQVTASGSYQLTTAPNAHAQLAVSSGLITSLVWAYSDGNFETVGNFYGGSVSTFVTGAGATDTINLVCTSTGAGSSAKFVGSNQAALIVTRVA